MSDNMSIEEQTLLESAPDEVQFNLKGTDCSIFAEKTLSKAGNVWFQGSPADEDGNVAYVALIESFEGSGLFADVDTDDAAAVLEALPTWQVGTDDAIVELKDGEVHLSGPRKYGKTHKQAGLAIPGTGGNPTYTASGSTIIEIGGVEKVYTLTVTVTAVHQNDPEKPNHGKLKGYTISPKAIPPSPGGKRKKATGRTKGFATVKR